MQSHVRETRKRDVIWQANYPNRQPEDLEKRQMPACDATVFPGAFPGALWPARTCLYESNWSNFL